MKRIIIVLLFPFLSILLFAGNHTDVADLFVESTEFPFVIKSSFVDDALEGNFSELSAKDMKALCLDVESYDNDGKSIVEALLKIDSLKKANVPTDEIQNQYWEFHHYSMVAVNKLTLNSGIVACIWVIRTADMNQSTDHLYITLCKKNKPFYYFTLPVSNSYSDSPMWTESTVTNKITRDGKIYVDANNKDGSYNDEDGTEHIDRYRTIKELQIKNDGLEELMSEFIEMSGETKEEIKQVDYTKFNAITVGNGLKLRAEPLVGDNIICRFNTGELVSILDKTSEREVLTKRDGCDKNGFYWYRVEDSRKYAGWVYGKYVYEIYKPDETFKIFNKKYKIGNKEYLFNYATDIRFDKRDDNGLSECKKYYMPYFYKEGKKTMPFYYDKEAFPDKNLEWRSEQYDGGLIYLVLSSRSGNDQIIEINEVTKNDNPALELIIKFKNQDNTTISGVYISDVNGKMEVVGIKVEE